MNIINEKVSKFLDQLYEPLNDAFGNFRKESEEKRIPIIQKDTESLLLNLLYLKRPEQILEIGTAVGYSACCFSYACPQATIRTIEFKEEMALKAKENISKMGMDSHIEVIFGDGRHVLAHLDRREKVDFVFIDGGKSHYNEFFHEILPLCSPGAVIVSDNILMMGKTVSDEYDPRGKFKTNIYKMREYLSYLKSRDDIHTSFIPVGDGLAISVMGE